MKKLLSAILLAAIILSAALPVTAYAAQYQPPFELEAEAAYLVNTDTGTVIYSKNADEKKYPASLTKIMTAVVTLENVADLDNESAEYKLYMQDALYGKNAQLGGIYLGEMVSIRGLLYAALLRSANEAALMLADYVGGGSQTVFLDMMNAKAQELGMTGTHFSSPNGLFDEQNYTTARDMAILSEYAMKNDTFADIVREYYVDIGPTSQRESLWEQSTNATLSPSSEYYYSPMTGIKTGTLDESGRCFAAAATQGGYSYICIILGAPLYNADGSQTGMTSFREATSLMEWAFSGFALQTVIEKGEILTEIPVEYSLDADYVRLVTAEGDTQLLPTEIDTAGIRMVYDLPEKLEAPVTAGQEIGSVSLVLADEEIGRVPLITADSVQASKLLLALKWIKELFSSTAAKLITAGAILLIAAYIVLMLRANKTREQRRRRSGSRYKDIYK